MNKAPLSYIMTPKLKVQMTIQISRLAGTKANLADSVR